MPDDHPLGGFQCSELCHGFFICCGYGQVQHFNGESLDASPCNPGLCYYFPYIGGILGFLVRYLANALRSYCVSLHSDSSVTLVFTPQMHYPLRQRLENKLVTGSTVGAVMTCPPVDAICVRALRALPPLISPMARLVGMLTPGSPRRLSVSQRVICARSSALFAVLCTGHSNLTKLTG